MSLAARLGIPAILLLLTVGCGHTLSPLFKDYRVDPARTDDKDLHTLIEQAVTEAGWTLDKSVAPNVVSTKEAKVTDWGLYKIVVSLDVAPINGTHVRVFVHPYRVYLWGTRSKMPYLSRSVRNYVVPDLTHAFSERGIVAMDVDLADGAAD